MGKKIFGIAAILFAVVFVLANLGISLPILTPLVFGIISVPMNLVGGLASSPTQSLLGAAKTTQSFVGQMSSFPVGKGLLLVVALVVAALARPLIHWLLQVWVGEIEKAQGAFHARRDVIFTVFELVSLYIGIKISRDLGAVFTVATIVYAVDYLGLIISSLIVGQCRGALGTGGWLTDAISRGLSAITEVGYQAIKIALPIAWVFAAAPSVAAMVGRYEIGRQVSFLSSSLHQIAGGNFAVIGVGIGLSLIRVVRDHQNRIWR